MTHRLIVVYGPPASGKTRNAKALANLFGCKSIYEESQPPYFDDASQFPALVLTNNPHSVEDLEAEDSVIHIDLALQLLQPEDQP